jgi:cytoskeletal protein CcmA (bactofilin family)
MEGLNMGMFSTAKRSPILGGGMDSIIGENARLKGELVSQGSVNIAGEFEGVVKAEGEVIVAPSGKVSGELHGGTVSVSGRVDGNIHARETLEVCKNGRVHGDLAGGRIVIEEGATYHGRVKVDSGQTEQPPPQAA